MVTMKISGYPEGFRKQIAISASRGVRRMEEREEDGGGTRGEGERGRGGEEEKGERLSIFVYSKAATAADPM